jgi:hypothetical protein
MNVLIFVLKYFRGIVCISVELKTSVSEMSVPIDVIVREDSILHESFKSRCLFWFDQL